MSWPQVHFEIALFLGHFGKKFQQHQSTKISNGFHLNEFTANSEPHRQEAVNIGSFFGQFIGLAYTKTNKHLSGGPSIARKSEKSRTIEASS